MHSQKNTTSTVDRAALIQVRSLCHWPNGVWGGGTRLCAACPEDLCRCALLCPESAYPNPRTPGLPPPLCRHAGIVYPGGGQAVHGRDDQVPQEWNPALLHCPLHQGLPALRALGEVPPGCCRGALCALRFLQKPRAAVHPWLATKRAASHFLPSGGWEMPSTPRLPSIPARSPSSPPPLLSLSLSLSLSPCPCFFASSCFYPGASTPPPCPCFHRAALA